MTTQARIPFRIRPMLATLVAKPFHRPGWVYEEKYDGYRLLAYKESDHVTLLSRTAHNRTEAFPTITNAVAKLKPRTLLLDGEVVAFDRRRVSQPFVVEKAMFVNPPLTPRTPGGDFTQREHIGRGADNGDHR